jgi:tetraacyldisaccharide 4'-kinase
MRTPDFWSQDGLLPTLLTPVSLLYDLAARLDRCRGRRWRAPVPVICVGNLTAGGAGKTPTAMLAAELLIRSGIDVHFLSRGYGGKTAGPVQVDRQKHRAGEVGDEPLLLAALAPTWIARDRVAGAKKIVEACAEAIIMDDGFQNTDLQKDLNILVIDGGFGFGNGRLLPAGPLREPVASGAVRADFALIIHTDGDRRVSLLLPPSLPVFQARVVPAISAESYGGRRVFGFAGIGRPEKFAATLRAIGADLVGFQAFPDHHDYREDEIMAVIEAAVAEDARAVTTAKDAVRLPVIAREMVDIVDIDLQLDDVDAFRQRLLSVVSHS